MRNQRRAAVSLASAVGALALLAVVSPWSQGTVFRGGDRATGDSQGYSVTMLPMGKVHFPHIPQKAVTLDANYNDILVALGEGNKLAASGYRGNDFQGFYHDLGVNVNYDPQKLTYLSGGGGGTFDKEIFYALHADVHHIDPYQLATMKGWSKADVDEIAHNVGPFFGNRYSRDDSYAGKDPYQYYSLLELSAKVGEVYRRPERIVKLKAVYEEMIQHIRSKLPPPEKRPRVGLVFYANGRFTPYSVNHGGFGQAQYRDVGVRDAFESIQGRTYGASSGAAAQLDKEGLLALDPDVLIVPFAIYPVSQAATSRVDYELLLKLKDDPVAQRLKAFRNQRVYPGGTPLQGPVFYLFQIEMAAKEIYPELFGAFREDRKYPRFEQLFDRQRVANILNGQ